MEANLVDWPGRYICNRRTDPGSQATAGGAPSNHRDHPVEAILLDRPCSNYEGHSDLCSRESANRWIHRLKHDQAELMHAGRLAVKSGALKRNKLRSTFRANRLSLCETQDGARGMFLSAGTIQRYTRLKHDGRYIRRPPIAQHRLGRIGRDQVEYLAKDTRNKQFVLKRYPNTEFII
jgi:hypothetical protein